MNLREAAEKALEALEDIFGKNKVDVGAINALRAALEEAEEPVAWRVRAGRDTGMYGPWRVYQQSAKPGVNHPECCDFEPLYTHPPRREPLTEEELFDIYDEGEWQVAIEDFYRIARAIERAHGIGGDE